ncbi:MAG TPA: DUF5107 domain-containing protein [Phycisphaerae bacterium]|nr:DUF5107 domain-containing protein [Phycisphaerae bacterium]
MSAAEAIIRQEPLTIPTYRVGEPEKNPIFYTGRGYQGAKGVAYPYPMLDKLSDVREDVTYQAVYLENPYIQLCVLPQIGGRIFSGQDKTNGYDFIYRQHVIKPALIGMLGAWISGGVEWNIPHHHRPTTFMPVHCRIAEGPGGSKTLWIGEIELRHRMKWVVGLTIHPDRSYLEVTTRIFNRTPYVHSLLCFTNVAVHVNEHYQVIFPPTTEYGTQHAKCEFIRWPIADGAYDQIDYTGVDVSWWKNHPDPLSIFAWNYEDDFFGGYDHGRQAGIVHVADHRAVPGKKFFTFGSGPRGQAWDRILTDEDGPYLELMAGAYSDNQPDYSWIQPYETKTVTQYWYPVRDLGGVSAANRDAAVHLSAAPSGGVRLAVNTTAEQRNAVVLLRTAGSELFRQTATVSPEKPFVVHVPLPRGARPDATETVLLASSGSELIRYRPTPTKGAPVPKPVEPPAPPQEVPTAEQLYLAGMRLEQFHSPAMEPDPYYHEALHRDPGDVRANTALGIRYCKRGLFADAEARLRTAVDRLTRNYTHPRDGEALYYLGVALRGQGQTDRATDAFSYAAWSYAFRAASHYALAQMALASGDGAAARQSVEQSLLCNALNPAAMNLKTVLLREAGRFDEAMAMAEAALQLDPLDFWAHNERVLIETDRGNADDARRDRENLAALMRDDVQSYLELACDYEACELWDEAIEVLSRLTVGRPDAGSVDPTVHYALAYYWQRQGQVDRAGEHRRLAARMPADCCFPHCMEVIGWLTAAMEQSPDDSRAPYCLGNLLYDLQPDRAIEAWERSCDLDDNFATVHRNLALAYARIDSDNDRAICAMQRAVDVDGDDPRLLLELDQLSEADGADPADRLARLEARSDVVARRDECLLRQARLHVLLGQYDHALALLVARHFHVWEGGEYAVHDVYVDAHLLKGQALARAGRHADALREYQAALQYPANFEAGRPKDGGREPEVFWLIGTTFEATGDTTEARAAFERAVQIERKGTHLCYYQGLCHRKLGRPEQAARCFGELVDLGRRVLSDESGADFFEKFGAWQAAPLRESEGHYLLALAALGQGDTIEAEREFRQAVRLNPSHLGARTMLAGLA